MSTNRWKIILDNFPKYFAERVNFTYGVEVSCRAVSHATCAWDTNFGLDVDIKGVVSHKQGDGYEHIPSNGAANQILKYLSPGKANWLTPAKLKLKFGNNTLGEYIITNQDLEVDLKNDKVGFLEKGNLPAYIVDAKGLYDIIENKNSEAASRLEVIENYLNLDPREATLGAGYLGDFYLG